jgi:class 3 adenylate cyclase
MEPQVQYAKTSDGVNIAFASMGEGPPLVRVPVLGAAHAQRDWAMFPNIFPPLTRTFRLILYDSRGTGLSDRDATDFSMGAMTRDLEAVIDRTGLRSFAVLAINDAVPIAVTYAATFSDRVSHLILIDGWTNWSDYVGTPVLEAHKALMDKDWTLLTETMARVFMGFDDPHLIGLLGEHFRACIEPEAYRALVEALKSYDVSALLAGVRAETLVLHNNNHRFLSVRAGQKLAAGIPDARFLAIDDMNYERLAPLVEEFAGTAEKAESVEPGAFRTVLFTDVEGSTALTQRLGDTKARELLREHERMVRDALKAHGGSEVKTMGDGFMTSFSSATNALECAIAMQRAFAERNAARPEPVEGRAEELRIRIGLNAGEPIAEDDPDGRSDLFGTAVILAARIAAQAEGGEILASEAVRQIVAGKKFPFSDRGETALRGFEDRVRIYQVSWREG